MNLISHQQGEWSVQKHLLADGFFVSNGWLKRPEDGHVELPRSLRQHFYGIRLCAGASSLAHGRHWETTPLSPGDSRQILERLGWEKEGESPGPSPVSPNCGHSWT